MFVPVYRPRTQQMTVLPRQPIDKKKKKREGNLKRHRTPPTEANPKPTTRRPRFPTRSANLLNQHPARSKQRSSSLPSSCASRQAWRLYITQATRMPTAESIQDPRPIPTLQDEALIETTFFPTTKDTPRQAPEGVRSKCVAFFPLSSMLVTGEKTEEKEEKRDDCPPKSSFPWPATWITVRERRHLGRTEKTAALSAYVSRVPKKGGTSSVTSRLQDRSMIVATGNRLTYDLSRRSVHRENDNHQWKPYPSRRRLPLQSGARSRV